MKIKSFFSHTIEGAIAMARREWGPEAILVQSRKAPREARHLGEYEVVFADGSPAAATGAFTGSSQETASSSLSGDRIATEVAGLKRQLEHMRRTLTSTAFASAPWAESTPLLSEAYTLLTTGEISADLAREVVQSAVSRAGVYEAGGAASGPSRLDEKRWQTALVEEMCSRCRVEPALGAEGGGSRIAALIGPPGSGKTSTLVKLAVNYGLASRHSVLLVTIDTYRVAAADQLRSYAAILGVGFEVTETISGLAQVIEENGAKDLILIDTPGLGFRDLEDHAALAGFLSSRKDIDRQLVLSSSMKSADLSRVIDSYRIFQPQHLLFTRLDETGSLGAIFNEAVRTQTPLSFLATGQRIPEDLETATHARLIESILGGCPSGGSEALSASKVGHGSWPQVAVRNGSDSSEALSAA
jgi:flagellar biosynthesis protein FlhF